LMLREPTPTDLALIYEGSLAEFFKTDFIGCCYYIYGSTYICIVFLLRDDSKPTFLGL
jgi:hypothetical protein